MEMTNTRRLENSVFYLYFLGEKKKTPRLKVSSFTMPKWAPSLCIVNSFYPSIYQNFAFGDLLDSAMWRLFHPNSLLPLCADSSGAVERRVKGCNNISCRQSLEHHLLCCCSLCTVVLLLGTESLFCGYLVFLSVFFFAIDLVSAELSTHVAEYQEEEEEEAEMAMV